MILAVFTLPLLSTAQKNQVIQNLEEEEQTAIEAIALYPEQERNTILTATMYPEILARMEQIRRYAEAEFKDVISGLSLENQKRIYNLARYPELLEPMSQRDKRWPRSEMRDLLEAFPEEIHDDAMTLNRKEFNVVKQIHGLLEDSETAFAEILDAYPANVRQAFRQLEQLPEVVSILNDHMSLTVLLGDLYVKDTEALLYMLDSLNVIVAEEKAAELNAWKEELENDPEAMHEYEEAALEFAEEQGYDNEAYSDPVPDRYRNDVYVHYVWRPYPYWFGWPVWYDYACWYPYPWWYHWGFYYGPNNAIVIIGLPSSAFVNWHFHYYGNFYYYPHFTSRVMKHVYYGPRSPVSNVGMVVRDWEKAHRTELPESWFQDDGNRAERIQEYGRFKLDYERAVREVYAGTPTEREFLRDNAGRYPTLKPVLKKSPRSDRPETGPAEYLPGRRDRPELYQPRDKMLDNPRIIRHEEIDRAKQRHEGIWQQMTKKSPRSASPSQRTPSRSQAPKAPQRKDPNGRN